MLRVGGRQPGGPTECDTETGEPEAKPMGYGLAPKMPSYNLQSVVDVESGLIVHHDVHNDANDSHLLHPMSVGAKEVLEVDQIQVLMDGGTRTPRRSLVASGRAST
jgi:hypothetical protein